MYSTFPPARTFVVPEQADDGAEGQRRPGFFRGVATVVTKLLNAVQPDRAYFGQKDGYQCIVVRQLARDLLLPTDIRIRPTVREQDGLAMSSRNAYLSEQQRRAAPALYRGLQLVAESVQKLGSLPPGGRDGLMQMLRGELDASGGEFRNIEYLDLACALTGRPIDRLEDSQGRGGAVLLSAAVRIGETRLIDNIVLRGGADDLGAA